jgi:DNA adenine methylase
MKTPISYYGGKQRIASKIVQEINKVPHSVYAEPFAGGLAVLYAKGVPEVSNSHHYREVINDTNEQLITFWRVAREQPEELNRRLQLTPYSQAEYRRALQIYRNPKEHGQLEVAWAAYIQCCHSFANKVGAGWAAEVVARNSAATHQNKLQLLPECFDRLKGVYIGCEDALRFIKRWDSPQTLFYCDPPYPGTNQGHYKGYTMEDYQALLSRRRRSAPRLLPLVTTSLLRGRSPSPSCSTCSLGGSVLCSSDGNGASPHTLSDGASLAALIKLEG